MNIGYSFWGYLGDLKFDPEGNLASTPDGYDIVMHCKSGMSSKGIFSSNAPIDAGYTGEIHAVLYNATDHPVLIKEGEKISQMVVRPVIYADYVTEINDNRGAGGFGSTGK